MRHYSGLGLIAFVLAAGVALAPGPAAGKPRQPVQSTAPVNAPFQLTSAQAKAVRVENEDQLEFRFDTRQAWDVGEAAQANAQWCVETSHSRTTTTICWVAAVTPSVTRTVRRRGLVVGTKVLAGATWSRSFGSTLVFDATPAELGLTSSAGSARWRASTRWTSASCLATGCASNLPLNAHARYSTPLQVGATPRCVARGPAIRTSGSKSSKAVALGIDDGPSAYTDAFINTLNRLGAHATFYLIGRQIAGHEAVLRKMLKSGDEIGDHTWAHQPGIGLSETVTAIEQATHGWRPCTYRPPEGNLGGWQQARPLGLITVTWSVDPSDWRTPGTPAITQRVLRAARPGSIVVLHDGGGNRSETLAALPSIVKGLQHRGMRVVSVQQLLHLTPR